MKRLVIELGTLPEEGKQLTGELSPEIFELSEDDARPLGPLRYDLWAQRFGDEFLLQGRLSAAFEFECVRTLKRFKQTIDRPAAAFAFEIGAKGEIDATEEVREEILLNFPSYPRCDEGDDPTPCEIDERYLALDKPAEDDVESPPAPDVDSRWAALDALDQPDKSS